MSERATELVARASYGRLLAILTARTGDIAACEDALAGAFEAALRRLPEQGVPEQPEAWLLAVARRRLLDGVRRAGVRTREADAVAEFIHDLAERGDADAFPDACLRLLFICTHPAIEPSAQVPLMLQTALGLDAAAIASAMRVAPKTMGQRLWRAKTKIREAGIPFEVPDAVELPQRVEAVLEAIYAAFGTAWEDVHYGQERFRDLGDEAIFLARLTCSLLPHHAEALGLLSLFLFATARRTARRSNAGEFVPLSEQDPSSWDVALLDEAEMLLAQAFALGSMGPYQLEAALQSAHVSGIRRKRVDHEAIVALYDGLVRLAPSLGALVGRAAALLEARDADFALQALDAIDVHLSSTYQPWWAVRAAALAAAGRTADADVAYASAMGLTEDQPTRQFLAERRARLHRSRAAQADSADDAS